MTEVRIAELKARLSEYLRVVRRGGKVVVLDRDTPVAEIVPIQPLNRLQVRRRKPDATPLKKLKKPAAITGDIDVADLLLEERGERL